MQAVNYQSFQSVSRNSEIQRQLDFQFINGLKAFLTLMTEPQKTDAVFDITDSLVHSRSFELAAKHIKSTPEAEAIVRDRYLAPTPDLDALLQLPQDSLGYIYANNLKQAGFNPEFYRKVRVDDDASYIELRVRQTHDIWHTVTGFDATPAGEIGLQAFYLAQCRLPMASMLIANALLSTTLLIPEQLSKLLSGIATGWEMGLNAKSFIAQRWEEHWEKPLEVWRAELNVNPVAKVAPRVLAGVAA